MCDTEHIDYTIVWSLKDVYSPYLCYLRPEQYWDSAFDRNALYDDEGGTPDNIARHHAGIKKLMQWTHVHIPGRVFSQSSG